MFVKRRSDCSFETVAINANLEVVIVASREDLKARLTCFEGNTILDPGSEHKRGAVDEVVHHIFEFWEERDLVYQVKVYLSLGSDLNPDVASNEEDITSHVVDFEVLHPFVVGFFILFEKYHGVA